METPDPKKVFVIHGRNDLARRAMFAFLRSVGLQPIEWTEAVKGTGQLNPFIGDILDSGLEKAQAIVALFTGDDLARIGTSFGEEPLTPQARLNVIFEAGMAMGRFPKRTILVMLGNSRPFSDIAGRLTVEMDDTVAKRQTLVIRLKDAGCDVNVDNQLDWHTEGEFGGSIHAPDKAKEEEEEDIPAIAKVHSGPSLLRFAVPGFATALAAAAIVWSFNRPPVIIEKPVLTHNVVVTGHIMRKKEPHEGILVGVMPSGATTITNSDGSYELRIPASQFGSYTAVAYDQGRRPYLGNIRVKDDRGEFDHVIGPE